MAGRRGPVRGVPQASGTGARHIPPKADDTRPCYHISGSEV